MGLDIMILMELAIIVVIIAIVAILIIYYPGVDINELRLLDDIEKKSAEIQESLIADLYKNIGEEECVKKSAEIEKLLIDTAQVKFELNQKHRIDRIKVILTFATGLITLFVGSFAFLNYIATVDKDRKERLDKQFVELSQKISQDNETSREIAIITFPIFTINEQKKPTLKKKYEDYDDFLSDFEEKYPYVIESTTIILNELANEAVKRAKDRCKSNNINNKCETTEELYPYFGASFSGTVFSNTIIDSLNLINKNTLQEDIEIGENASTGIKKVSALNLTQRDFRGAYIRNAYLEGAQGSFAKFSFANLSGTSLSNSNLKVSEFINTDLRFAVLINTNMERALAKGANFTGAILENTDLRKAVLIDAKFNGSTLKNTRFNGAILYKTNFLGKPADNINKPFDELLKLGARIPLDNVNYEDAKIDLQVPPDFTDAIIDYKNYLSFKIKTSDNLFYSLREVYSFNEINESEFSDSKYSYLVKIYLMNEIKKGNKIGKLEKYTNKNVNFKENSP